MGGGGGGGVGVAKVLKQARGIFIQIIKIIGIFNKHNSKTALGYASEVPEHTQQRSKGLPSMVTFNLVHRDFGLKFLNTPKSWRRKGIVHVS